MLLISYNILIILNYDFMISLDRYGVRESFDQAFIGKACDHMCMPWYTFETSQLCKILHTYIALKWQVVIANVQLLLFLPPLQEMTPHHHYSVFILIQLYSHRGSCFSFHFPLLHTAHCSFSWDYINIHHNLLSQKNNGRHTANK